MNLEKVINESLEDNFSGTILIIKDREVIFNKNYGYRDWANKIENNNTTFGTASAEKPL